jgi:hypothetical protein
MCTVEQVSVWALIREDMCSPFENDEKEATGNGPATKALENSEV